MAISEPVARTAFYCCVIRADDAAVARPVCGDTFAVRFVDDEIRRDLAPLLRLRAPAASNVTRHRIIDDLVREQLAANPDRRVILIGAGFDTRAFRIAGGRWFELDDPPLLEFKEQRLPAAMAPNPLTRIPVAFDAVAPTRYLAPLAGDDDALVILEGVSMYLSDRTLRELAAALAGALPKATLVCDLMSPVFARTFSRTLRQRLAEMGAVFGEQAGHPRTPIEEAGYRCSRCISIPGRAAAAGTVPIPSWVMNTVLRTLRDGYQVWVFRLAA